MNWFIALIAGSSVIIGVLYLLFREAQSEVERWRDLYLERGRRAQATCSITLEAIDPPELLHAEMDVWVRVSDKSGYWPEVEIIGAEASVRGFVEMHWGTEVLEHADEAEMWTNLSYPAER